MAGYPTVARVRPLSAAILAGCQLHPLTMAEGSIGGREGQRALVAAWLSQFLEPPDPHEPDVTRGYTADRLARLFPELVDGSGQALGWGCPAGPIGTCPGRESWVPGRSLEQQIAHLQDPHGFNREHVAAWLRAHGH